MNDDKIYLDKKGFEEYLSEIEQLKEKIKINSIEKGEASRSDGACCAVLGVEKGRGKTAVI